MDWELAIKVATILVGGLTLLDKGYELIKKRQARRRVYSRHLKSPSFLTFLKKKLSTAKTNLLNNDLILMSNYMGVHYFIKKNDAISKLLKILAG